MAEKFSEEEFLKGNNALGEALIRAGCRFYCGYPITPVSDLLEYLSWRMPQAGGVFVQVESEVAAINMVEGAAATGKRTATASSGPGMSLMQEGISYICGAELPCVIINMSRSGPALGGITAGQTDYFQSTRGGGHGPYRTIVLAPSTMQEMVDMALPAFELAEKYRNPVLILADAMLGQMYELVKLPPPVASIPAPPSWALTGAKKRPRNKIPEFFSGEKINLKLNEKFETIIVHEQRSETWGQGEDVLLVAFGTTARVCKSVVLEASRMGIRAGLFRPITLFPFPYDDLKKAAEKAKKILVVEMGPGQLIDDVKIAAANLKDIEFYGRLGGIVPTKKEIMAVLSRITGRQEGR
jgi:2-oxoglutarate ferredoxin oxidoreductase subunit alpha